MQNKLDLIEQLQEKYLQDPGSQPTAFWKCVDWASHPDARLVINEYYSGLALGDRLLLREPPDADFQSSFEKTYTLLSFSAAQSGLKHLEADSFFKLVHNHQKLQIPNIPKGLKIISATLDDSDAIANFINRNYTLIHVSADQVFSWSMRNTYNPELWIWVVDAYTEERLGLGIAEADLTIGEGALEWIQVEVHGRGKGIGTLIVQELLTRLSKTCRFTTVSGEIQNGTNPESLYRNCGFTGNWKWYIYR